jgi:hypothetical protein
MNTCAMNTWIARSAGAVALVLLAWFAGSGAASAAYCAMYNNGSRACGIPDLQMCMQTVSGVGGTCQQDLTTSIPPNFVQRLRNESQWSTRSRTPGGGGSSAPQRPIRTSPCMSLSGDTCGNYLH